MSSYFYTPHIHKPTRTTNHTATLIDNIFFNSIKYHTISGNILSDISDHLPNFLIINQLNALPKKFKIYKREYSNLDETALMDEIQSVNWETIFPHDCDVNIIFDRFYSTIADIIDKHVPVEDTYLPSQGFELGIELRIELGIRARNSCSEFELGS